MRISVEYPVQGKFGSSEEATYTLDAARAVTCGEPGVRITVMRRVEDLTERRAYTGSLVLESDAARWLAFALLKVLEEGETSGIQMRAGRRVREEK